MKALLFFLVLFQISTIARAELTYKCAGLGEASLFTASLRFSENGTKGALELDYWQSYPPAALVYGELRAEGGRFQSEVDRQSRYSAVLELPAGFTGQDSFPAKFLLQRETVKGASFELRCLRF